MRIGLLPEPGVVLEPGAEFVLTGRDVPGDVREVSLTYRELPGDVQAGDTLLLADGAVQLTVPDLWRSC